MAKRVAATGPVDGPWALPDDWRWESIGTVCRPTEKGSPASRFADTFRYTDVGGIGEGVEAKVVPVGEAPSRARQFVRPGDTLFSGVRVNLRRTVFVKPNMTDVASTAFSVLSPGVGIEPGYLFRWMTSDFLVSSLIPLQRGSQPPAVLDDDVRAQPIAVPPLDVQHKIIARIDELFAEIDDGEAALTHARNDLATWRKALLKAAVTGELTADWRAANPSIESAADLMARILTERRARWPADNRNAGKRYADAAEPALEGVPNLPAGWTWVGIEQLTTGGIRNGLSLKEATGPTAVKGLKLDALQPGGVDWSRTRNLPIDLVRAAPYLLRAGDLLISRANGSPEFVGRCTMVDEGRDDTVFPDTAIRYPVVDQPLLRVWARLAWSAPQSRKRMLALAKSTAGILKISQGDIAAVALPLPPLAEIDEIVDRVERLTSEAEAGADDLAAMKLLPATLRQSVLAAAFRGELA